MGIGAWLPGYGVYSSELGTAIILFVFTAGLCHS